MLLSYKTVIVAGLLPLALSACVSAGSSGGEGDGGATAAPAAPVQTDDTRCGAVPGPTPDDCRIMGSGQMTPNIRK